MTSPAPGPPPPRRHYADRDSGRGRPRRSLESMTYHVGPAAVGFGVGAMWVIWTGALPFYTPLLTAAATWAITQLVLRLVVGTAAAYADPTGSTTPHRAEYSQARALAAQGRYTEAVAAYELAAAESAGDPTPYVEIARIQRDQLRDCESAAAWFRRARRDARLNAGQELLVTQELIELYTKRLGQPQRAIPELARIPRLLPGSPQAAAAEREIAALRATLGDGTPGPG